MKNTFDNCHFVAISKEGIAVEIAGCLADPENPE